MDGKRVAVVGGGISGISTAFRILQTLPGVRVTVIAEKFSPETTGDGAAGLCIPFLMGDTPLENQMSWAKQTFDFLKKIFKTNLSQKLGISLVYGFWVFSTPQEEPIWKDYVFGFREMTDDEKELFNSKHGFTFGTFVAKAKTLLPFLTRRIQLLGGQIRTKKVENFEKLADDYDLVVNCTGVWAKYLTKDPHIHPLRGQVIRVAAPWITTFLLEGEEHYVIPNSDAVVVGGTHQKDNWSVAIDSDDRDHILNRCYQLIPSLRDAEILKEWAGLRPGRNTVRLEREELHFGYRSLKVVHNYGHGGSGITVFWGCACEAATLVALSLGLKQTEPNEHDNKSRL